MEQGATRNFEAVRRLGQMLEMEKEARAEEEANSGSDTSGDESAESNDSGDEKSASEEDMSW